jgi:hypothetical protein
LSVMPREGGHPVRRGFSTQALTSLGYWIARFRGRRQAKGLNAPGARSCGKRACKQDPERPKQAAHHRNGLWSGMTSIDWSLRSIHLVKA